MGKKRRTIRTKNAVTIGIDDVLENLTVIQKDMGYYL
jgi:hypothetical protein